MRRILLAVLILAGCTTSTTVAPVATTAAPAAMAAPAAPAVTSTSLAVPDTTVQATTTAVASTTTTIRIDAGPCAFGEATPQGEVTYIRAGELRGLRMVGAQFVDRCLLNLQPSDTGRVTWGPQGDRVLLGNSTFVIDGQRLGTGFASTDVVTWSAPKGTALLRVDPVHAKASKQTNLQNEAITDFAMAEVNDALYHPAGKNIAFVGRPEHSSPYGIWLMSNEGLAPKLITVGEDAKRIRLIGWEGGGQQLVFWAEHLDGQRHLHRLAVPGLTLADLERPGSPLELSDMQRNDTGALVTGACSEGSLHLSVADQSSPNFLAWPLKPRDARLVGIMQESSASAIVGTRATSCDGPEDLWSWAAELGTQPVLLAAGASNIAVRRQAPPPIELPDDITARAPG